MPLESSWDTPRVRMTQRYAHLAPESLEKVALSLEGQLNKKSTNVLNFVNTKAV